MLFGHLRQIKIFSWLYRIQLGLKENTIQLNFLVTEFSIDELL